MTVPAVPARRRWTRVSRRQIVTFLRALEDARTVMAAARLAGPHVRTFYRLRDRDPRFAEAWDAAYERGTDVIRDEIRRRAVEGWEEPVFQGGQQVGSVRKFSDRLLELEAKRRDPSYRDSVSAGAAQPVEIRLVSVLALAQEQRPAIDAPMVIEGTARELDPGEPIAIERETNRGGRS